MTRLTTAGRKVMSDPTECNNCREILSTSDKARRSNRSICRNCLNAWYRDYYSKNRDKQANRSRKYRSTIKGRAKMIMSQIKHRSKKFKLRCDVTQQEIEHKLSSGVCEASALPLNLENVMVHWDNPLGPSVDRVSSVLGYTTGNVQIVCNMYNRGKNKHDEIDFIAMCVAVAEINRHRPEVIERLNLMRSGNYKQKGMMYDQAEASTCSEQIRAHEHSGEPEC